MTKKNTLRNFICLALLFITLLQSCLVSRPRYVIDKFSAADSLRPYHQIVQPYRKKKISLVGGIFCLGVASTVAYMAYSNAHLIDSVSAIKLSSSMGNDNAKNVYGGTGLVLGYLVSKIMMSIAGSHKETYLDNYHQFSTWLMDYNKQYKKDLVLIKDSTLSDGTVLWAIAAKDENKFLPKTFQDVKNFSNTFYDSPHADDLIKTANSFLSKPELKRMIAIYPTNVATLQSKIIYVNKSQSEREFSESIDDYPEIQNYVEQNYSHQIETFFYAKDFINRYPQSDYLDSVFSKIYLTVSHPQLDSLIQLYALCKKPTLTNGKLAYIQQCSSVGEMFAALKKYPFTPFAITQDDNLATYNNAKSINDRLQNYHSTIASNGLKNVITDLRFQYLNSAYENNKGSAEEMTTLLNHALNEAWLKGSNTDSLVVKIAQETAASTNEPYFSGKKENGLPTGFGKLFKPNKDILEGNFVDGKLNGKGNILHDDGDYYEGTFVDNELDGMGLHRLKSGVVMKGMYKHNELNGKGIWMSKDSSVYKKGDFVGDKLNGNGEQKFANGNIYIGGFVDGRCSGSGKFIFTDTTDKWFEGMFANGKRNGKGEFHLATGYVIKGRWSNDCPDGEILITRELGTNSLHNYKSTWTISNCIVDEGKKDTQEGIDEPNENDVLQKIND